MLGGKDDTLHTCTLERCYPLLHIQDGGSEGLRWCIAVAPLKVIEGIQSKVYEGIGL